MEDITLREVCTALGVSRRAVQGYENESLVTATGKNNRGYLLYDSKAQERIKKIKLYQDMGFSLKQIKEIIDDSGSVLRNALIQQKEKLNQEIEQKTHMIHIIQEIRTPHRKYRPIMTIVPWKAFEKESKVIFPTPFRKSPKNLKKQILLLDIAMKSISRTNNCSQTGIHLQYQRKMLCLKEP